MKNKYEILVGAEKFIDSLKCDLDDCHDNLYVQFMAIRMKMKWPNNFLDCTCQLT